MKRIAIITPCILPVPATKGGAVEGLISRIIEDNEKYGNYIIDLFSISHDVACNYSFSYTKLIQIQSSIFIAATDRILDKYYRTTHAERATRILDSEILKAFVGRISAISEDYDAVIVENMMSTACKIVHYCDGKYEFPIYFHMHNDVDMYRCPAYTKDLVRHGVQFIAVSQYIKNRILSIDSNALVHVLYNGIDLSKYTRSEKKKDSITTLMYAGRIIPEKGVKELTNAFNMVCESLEEGSRNNIDLKIVGFSGFNQGYENKICRLVGKHENIECIGQIPEDQMPLLYNLADAVVMPTIDEEPFGLVALETMAKGIPLIVTNSGALPEVVGDGACIVPKDENIVQNLSTAILKFASDYKYAQDIAKKGYNRAHGKISFDINNYYNNFDQILEPKEITPEDKISVIVPVYNVSEYLRRCVSSITNQTYQNTEIVLIDDGSTDESGNICDELALSDNRIKVIHQENKGLSGARNTGLDNSTGSFIFFCDSDDYLKNDALDKMLFKLKQDHADIVACGILNDYSPDSESDNGEEMFTSSTPGRWSGHESVIQMMRSNNVCSVAWNKLYRKELFDGIRFPEGVYNEDEAVTYKLLYRAGIVSYMPEPLYVYYQRQSSIMHEDLENRYSHFIDAAMKRIEFFKNEYDTELEQHSRITLLEWIKYSYRNVSDKALKQELLTTYKDNVGIGNVPSVMGAKKKMALLLWKYYRY